MKNLLILIFTLTTTLLFGQMDTIEFINPSFEGEPKEGRASQYNLIKGWRDCGFRGETPPDVHPVVGSNFSVSKSPSDGNAYLGMVTRDNDTWEKIGQRLRSPLEAEKCYTFSIDIARSETYLSQSRMSNKPANYVRPIKLRIYGGNNSCSKVQLLGETHLIKNTLWLTYSFELKPVEDYDNIVLEAFYYTPTLYPYNGNILIDNLSAITQISCDSFTEIQRLKQLLI